MNPAQLAETLKTVPDQHLVQAVQGSIPSTPGYLALAEMKRRESLRGGQAMGQAPMTTVAQDQQQQMGIGGLKPQGFAAGGVVSGGPGEEPPLFGLLRRLGSSIQTGNQQLEQWLAARGMPRYGRRNPTQEELMAPYVPREPQGLMRAGGGEPPQGPMVPIPEITVAGDKPAPAPVQGVVPKSGGTKVGIAGVASSGGPSPAVPALPEAQDITAKDPNELLGKVPTSKILEDLAKQAQIDPKEFERRRGESKEQALARFGAALASRPGGFGGAFGQAVNAGLDYNNAAQKEIRGDEKDAQKTLRDIKLAQAQEEINRFGIARDMSKEQAAEATKNWERKYGASRDKVDIEYRERALAQQAQIAREKIKADLQAAGIMAAARAAGAGGQTKLEKIIDQATDNARQMLAIKMKTMEADPRFTRDLQKDPGLMDRMYQEALAAEFKRMGISGLLQGAPNATVPTAPAASGPGATVVDKPPPVIRGR
jgi:hypothetical protein